MTNIKIIISVFFTLTYLVIIQGFYGLRDNVNYSLSFLQLSGSNNVVAAFYSYKNSTGASEPIYFVLQFVFSNFISYEFFTTLLNASFLWVLFLVLGKYFEKKFLAYFIILIFDYYLFRLTGELHRFKVSVLFFMLFLYFDGGKKKSCAILISILSHFQIILIYPYFILKKIRIKRVVKTKVLYNISFLVLFSCAFILIFSGSLLAKVQYYLSMSFPYSTFIIGAFYFLYLVFLQDKKGIFNFLMLFIIIAPVSFLIGSDRVNIYVMEFIFLSELYQLLERKRLFSLFVLFPVFLYNIYKIFFLFNEVV